MYFSECVEILSHFEKEKKEDNFEKNIKNEVY